MKVLYLNGGHPTWGALDYVKLLAMALCSFSPHRAVAAVCRWTSLKFCLLLRFSVTLCFYRKLNFAWLNALPRLRRVAHSSQVDILENSDLSCLAFFYRHSSPDQGNGSLSGMPDSRPGEFSKCGQSLLIVTYYGTWVLMGMGGGGILVLWLCSTCSPVILEVTLSLETHCRLLCFDKIITFCVYNQWNLDTRYQIRHPWFAM